jgi:outer membrane protein assembly factor BamB/Icc-related predicted phosphoesterase
MKKIYCFIIFLCFACIVEAQVKAFRFIHISDTHIGSPDGVAEDDLRRTVADINAMQNVDFVVITGDITELGTDSELARAKQLLDSLRIPYYIMPGNHDTGWSESGGVSFTKTFGYDKFSFDHNGIRFIGCASGPYVRMSDGHIPREAIVWLDSVLAKTSRTQPLIFLNHYPIDNSLDNWYEITDRLRRYNTVLIACGHGHSNHKMNFEDIPGIMGRSNLRAKAPHGGYNIVDITGDSIIYTERRPGVETLASWASLPFENKHYDTLKQFPRPVYAINDEYKQVRAQWVYSSDANVISTPASGNGMVVFGNQKGRVDALNLLDGRKKWSYQTAGAIYSSPAFYKNDIIFGSGDGNIYCLKSNGKLKWKFKTDAAVLGCPLIENDMVYIGGSDHRFRAIDARTGKPVWEFNGLNGPVVSTPVLYEGKIIFGAWDTNLYALNKDDGKLVWKWNNGSTVRNYSPASCIPVIKDGVVYIVAPDRFITALDAANGTTLWRNRDGGVRESIGISEDGNWVYGKSMQDTIVAYRTSRTKQDAAWKYRAGFGYEHVPSMLIEKDGALLFGTRLGVVYSIDPVAKKTNWAYKIDNSMVNTVRMLSRNAVIASTMDGKIAYLKAKE